MKLTARNEKFNVKIEYAVVILVDYDGVVDCSYYYAVPKEEVDEYIAAFKKSGIYCEIEEDSNNFMDDEVFMNVSKQKDETIWALCDYIGFTF